MTASNTISISRADTRTSSGDLLKLGIMVLLWGFSWPAMKICLLSISPLWLATIRFGSAALCLFLFTGMRGELRLPVKQDIPIIASVGLLQMMAFTVLGLIAMTKVAAGQAALLAYTTPLWVSLITVVVLRRSLEKSQLYAVIAGLLGIVVVISPSLLGWQSAAIIGDIMLLGAALCWSIVIVHVKQHPWHGSPLILAPWQMLLSALPLMIIALVTEGIPHINWNTELVSLLVFIGPLATCCCFVISLAVGRRINPVSMSVATLGVPVIGLFSSILFLGEKITLAIAVGVVLILCSLVGILVGPAKMGEARK
mgnify:FL=1